MKKRYIAFILIMILTLSTFGIATAFAGISGNSDVYAGETYNFSVSQSASASSISGNISWSGFASGSETMWEDSSSGTNENITASKTISISVPAGTPAGSTCTINVSGQISTFDGTTVGESSYSDSKTITVVDRPASTPKPQKTPKPSSSNKTESKPTSTPEPSAWQLASDEVDGMDQGGTLTVDLTGKDDDHEIPVEIYNVLREKKGKLTLNFGSYSCTLDGAALGELDEDEDELDLGLSFEADEEYSAAVGGNDVYQLHFDHKGQFPGKISFTFKAEKNKPGDTVYLYYYYGTSKVIEGIQSAVVDENGFVTFDIYHCSSYFVSSELLEGAAGIVTQAEPEPTPTPEPKPTPTPEPTADPTPELEPNPLTAELTPINGFPLAVLISVGFGAALLAVLFTMIIFRVGLFRKKSTRRSEY